MFRWPVELTPLSLGSSGVPRTTTLEVTPRGAAFTLAARSHVGHPAHLALIDAYLNGQIRSTSTSSIGEDSRTVAASLAAPLVAAYELGVERLSLADLILLPRDQDAATEADPAPGGRPTRSPDCARLLLRTPDAWHWIRSHERFEQPGCLGIRQVGREEPWHHLVAELPGAETFGTNTDARSSPAPIAGERRAPSGRVPPLTPEIETAARALAMARFSRSTSLIKGAADRLHERVVSAAPPSPLSPNDVEAERREHARSRAARLPGGSSPVDLAGDLADPISQRRPTITALRWRGLATDVTLEPDLDGYQTLCLLPPADADPSGLFETMREVAWQTIEALIGRPLAERRTEPIALRLVGHDGRATTLDVGASVVIVRNQTVFTAWVGSDGRVMLKLFPPGGMPAR